MVKLTQIHHQDFDYRLWREEELLHWWPSSIYCFEVWGAQKSFEIEKSISPKIFPSNPRQVPHIRAFHRLIKKFENHGTVQHLPITGRRPATVYDVGTVKQFSENSPKASIRLAVNELEISYGRIWKILMQNLEVESLYINHIWLSPANKISRVQACEF